MRYRGGMSLKHIHSLDEHEMNCDLPQIGLRTLQSSTNPFSEANKLVQGGFGPVCKGMLHNGQEIAVKMLSRSSGQGLREFKNEVKLIANLQHKNLVRLLGCCLEKDEMLLIYEYLSNGSLDAFINDPQGRSRLDWEKRYHIIIGTARGILHLHHDSRLNIIHRDLKAANVLLDEELNPKPQNFRFWNGKDFMCGYMAPEYAMNGLFSTKSDVYSFGVLLLEIISGQLKKAFRLSHLADTLVGYAWRLWSQGEGYEFIDPLLRAPVQLVKC